MTQKRLKIKEIALGLLIALSLFASSVAACVCSHHAAKVETKTPSCHSHFMPESDAQMAETPQKLDAGEECLCFTPAPRVFSKSETVKIEKQAPVASVAEVEAKTVFVSSPTESFYFEKPFYLSDSFQNLSPARAPPVL